MSWWETFEQGIELRTLNPNAKVVFYLVKKLVEREILSERDAIEIMEKSLS